MRYFPKLRFRIRPGAHAVHGDALFQPLVITAAVYPKHAAQLDTWVLLAQLVDQFYRSRESDIKRAVAFFKISFSRSIRRIFASNSWMRC